MSCLWFRTCYLLFFLLALFFFTVFFFMLSLLAFLFFLDRYYTASTACIRIVTFIYSPQLDYQNVRLANEVLHVAYPECRRSP